MQFTMSWYLVSLCPPYRITVQLPVIRNLHNIMQYQNRNCTRYYKRGSERKRERDPSSTQISLTLYVLDLTLYQQLQFIPHCEVDFNQVHACSLAIFSFTEPIFSHAVPFVAGIEMKKEAFIERVSFNRNWCHTFNFFQLNPPLEESKLPCYSAVSLQPVHKPGSIRKCAVVGT